MKFSKMPHVILEHKELSETAKLVYCTLLDYVGNNDTCWPTQNTIAERLGYRRETVNRAIAQLEQYNLIEIIKKRKTPTQYKLLVVAKGVTADAQSDAKVTSDAVTVDAQGDAKVTSDVTVDAQGCDARRTRGVTLDAHHPVRLDALLYKDELDSIELDSLKKKKTFKKENPPPEKKPQTKNYPMFDDWEPDDWDSIFEYGYSLGFDVREIDHEFGEMRDYFLEKPNVARAGWDRTFKKWLHNKATNFGRQSIH